MSDSDSDSSLPSKITRSPTSITKSKPSSKSKGKEKTKAAADATKKSSEEDPAWAFQPPEGMSVIEDVEDNGEEWDWDAFRKNDELELWLIRVPNGIKPKHLENLSIDLPEPSSSKKPSKSRSANSKVGVLNRKTENYDVWDVDLNRSSSSSSDGIVGGIEVGRIDDSGIYAEEMKGLSCILPRKKKRGELFIAPRPIKRHLVVTAQPPKPSVSSPDGESPETSSEVPSIPTQNPPRFSYPKEMLKHRFVAFGSTKEAATSASDNDGEDGSRGDQMDVDTEPPVKLEPQPVKEKAKEKEKKEKSKEKKDKEKSTKEPKESKKRKTAEEGGVGLPSPKKQKKAKK
ncbi:hypothetical protein GYMLUDRAFT_410975 [Collybiopsis luxurians FD-317 M1]|nr:hypothetical protein GYMLUDRAFT_410975 [Collybiopsis luxurians FD-317 M1]